jgi:hypothetical protein
MSARVYRLSQGTSPFSIRDQVECEIPARLAAYRTLQSRRFAAVADSLADRRVDRHLAWSHGSHLPR